MFAGADTTMQIDRNERARIGVQIRKDARLTHTAKHVGQTLLFFFMGALGRAWPKYETLAEQAGVSVRSAKRAIPQLIAAGYLTRTRRWGPNPIQRHGRWTRTCLSNLYVWVKRLSAKPAPKPRPDIKKEDQAPLPPDLAAALARFGNSLANKLGLPPAPTPA